MHFPYHGQVCINSFRVNLEGVPISFLKPRIVGSDVLVAYRRTLINTSFFFKFLILTVNIFGCLL